MEDSTAASHSHTPQSHNAKLLRSLVQVGVGGVKLCGQANVKVKKLNTLNTDVNLDAEVLQ